MVVRTGGAALIVGGQSFFCANGVLIYRSNWQAELRAG
jgi:hypothetical protein